MDESWGPSAQLASDAVGGHPSGVAWPHEAQHGSFGFVAHSLRARGRWNCPPPDEEPCTDSDPAVKDTFVVNRVAVPVTFTVNGTEASLDPGEARTFNDTGENPKVVVGGRQQALMNQDPIIGIPAVGCPVPAPSSPDAPPSSPSAPAPLSPKFTG